MRRKEVGAVPQTPGEGRLPFTIPLEKPLENSERLIEKFALGHDVGVNCIDRELFDILFPIYALADSAGTL